MFTIILLLTVRVGSILHGFYTSCTISDVSLHIIETTINIISMKYIPQYQTFLGNRFSVKRKKLVRLQILFFASKGHMPVCITILMMFVLTKQKCGLL